MSGNPDVEVEFLGLSLAAAPPVGHLHLELRQGVTALYGENGVGKTRILNAVSELLLGLAEPSQWGAEWMLTGAANPDRMVAAYQRGGIHIRAPLTPATILYDAWRPGFVRQLAGELEPDRVDDAWMLWAMVTTAIRLALPWSDALDDEAEYLLGHGRWLLVPNNGDELAYLCDPDPHRGPLAERWAESDHLWQTSWDGSVRLLEQPGPDLPSQGWLKWQRWKDDGYWDVPSWPLEQKHLPPRPLLPATPEAMGLPAWPEWAGFPVIEAPAAGLLSPVRLINPPVVEDPESAVEHTVRRLATLQPRDGKWYPDEAVTKISSEANAILCELFLDPPELSCSVNDIRRWFLGDRPIEWTASVHRQPPIPLNGLGEAHRRFSSFAIQQATSPAAEIRRGGQPGQRLSTAVIDEPERALHQLAIEPVASGLAAIADYVVVATHASEVLAFADHRYHVTIDESGYASLEQPTMTLTSSSLATEAHRLGLKPDRLVAIADVILLVEGQHDIEVLSAFMAPELARHIVPFVALGGTDGLSSIAESAYLFTTSSAPIVICLDSLDRSVGFDVRQLKEAGSSREQYRVLEELRNQPRYRRQREMRALVELLREAVNHGRLDRLCVFGFSKPDIVRYVDVDLITPREGSWDDLEKQFLESNQVDGWRAGDGRLFKSWIGDGYKVPGVRAASARQVERWKGDLGIQAHRHPDFGELAALLDELHPGGKNPLTS